MTTQQLHPDNTGRDQALRTWAMVLHFSLLAGAARRVAGADYYLAGQEK